MKILLTIAETDSCECSIEEIPDKLSKISKQSIKSMPIRMELA